jgi:uncharacterized protein YkwD
MSNGASAPRTAAAIAALAFLPGILLSQELATADKKAMVDAHNQVRCGVNPTAQTMPPLAWDATLEATAQAWADQCQDTMAPLGLLDHNPNRSVGHPWYVGENIYGSLGMANPASAVSLWTSEAANYSFAANTCSGVCGHYTQEVWAATRWIGCARSYCSGFANPSSIVCDYGPGGNDGNRPYTQGSGVTGACDLIFQDGFEFNDMSGWSSAQTGGGDLSVAAAAAIQGGFGLQAVVNDTAGLYVVDETPADAGRYRARFYVHPNGFDPGEAQSHFRTRIFIAFEEAPTRRLAAVVLKRQGGVYSLMARARLDDNSQADTGFTTITNAPHAVEIDWKRSTGPGASDGSLQMWIDGVAAGNLTGLDNSLSAVDFVRLGALSVKTGATGTLYLDALESRHQTYIGP